MDGLNYHHLFYFWTVAKAGSISKASVELHLSQPTISEQIRLLEASFGKKLFDRIGRSLILTDTGNMVYDYAGKIFSIGNELTQTLQGETKSAPPALRVVLDSSIADDVATRLLKPVLNMKVLHRLSVRRDQREKSLAMLSAGEADLVLAGDVRIPGKSNMHRHLLLECGTLFLARTSNKFNGQRFPKMLEGKPFLLPPEPLRSQLQSWFKQQKVNPKIVAEFEGEHLMRSFGECGWGMFTAPDLKPPDLLMDHKLKVVGRVSALRSRFFALTAERRPRHPAVTAVLEHAKRIQASRQSSL